MGRNNNILLIKKNVYSITRDDHNSFCNEHFCLLRENFHLVWGHRDHLN